MNLTDVYFVLEWYSYIFLIGILFIPLTQRIFSKFTDSGYIFAKTLGILLISYSTFLLGVSHILSFSRGGVFFILIFFGVIQFLRFRFSFVTFFQTKKKYFLVEELLFLSGLFLWSYVRGFAPEIHGLEKYMDYGFINSILRAEYFPPKDIWLSPELINYYYFGHFVTAVLTKLSDIPSRVTYNLMLGTLVGLTFASSFSIAINLFAPVKSALQKHFLKIILAGLLTASLVTFSGNLHSIYTLYKPYENEKPIPFWELGGPLYTTERENAQRDESKDTTHFRIIPSLNTFPNSYWYPNATRFIHNTIHEFPLYSWVVSDLHGHVTDIPFVLLATAYALSLYFKSLPEKNSLQEKNRRINSKLEKIIGKKFFTLFFHSGKQFSSLAFAGFLLATLYMTNAWDGMIYMLLFALVIFILFWQGSKERGLIQKIISFFPTFILSMAAVFLSFVVFALPFSLFFNPSSIVGGIGLLCAPKFLIAIERIGPFLFEADHCQRSPLWQLFILYGFFYFFIISFLLFLSRVKKMLVSDIFVLILIFLGTVLILIPEFIYLKDIYPDHYRANTMFKLVFQAFILLSIASGYIIVRIISSIKYQALRLRTLLIYSVFFIFSLFLLSIVFIYPFQATNSYYGNLTNYKGLDGLMYLKESYPNDFAAIKWLNKNITGQPIILEAQGDSYTDYARVSSNTGLPTVLGWTVHEWLWRGSYDVPAPRIGEIQTIYETNNIESARKLLRKYYVQYVFVGELEREKYPALNEEKFLEFGQLVFQKGETRIYIITP